MLKNVLIVVDDIEKSIEFYKDLFGLQVILQNEGNVILSEGLVLQDADVWGKTLNENSTPFNNMMELYFEEFDIDGLLAKYESGKYSVRYATELTEIAGGQKLVRLYDPSGNLIEVRTPFNNRMELYLEDFDIDGLLAKYESGKYFVRYATELTELAGGQKLVRLYDPSGNLIEVRTPFRDN